MDVTITLQYNRTQPQPYSFSDGCFLASFFLSSCAHAGADCAKCVFPSPFVRCQMQKIKHNQRVRWFLLLLLSSSMVCRFVHRGAASCVKGFVHIFWRVPLLGQHSRWSTAQCSQWNSLKNVNKIVYPTFTKKRGDERAPHSGESGLVRCHSCSRGRLSNWAWIRSLA